MECRWCPPAPTPLARKFGSRKEIFCMPGISTISRFLALMRLEKVSFCTLLLPGILMTLLTAMGWAVGGIDTWLHGTTKAISIPLTVAYYYGDDAGNLIAPPQSPSAQQLSAPKSNFSTSLNTSFCSGGKISDSYFDVQPNPNGTCSILWISSFANATDFGPGESTVEIVNLDTVLQVYNNQSNLFQINSVDGISFLGPIPPNLANSTLVNQTFVDFSASTIGIQTECESVNTCQFTNASVELQGQVDSTDLVIRDPGLFYNCTIPNTVYWSGLYSSHLQPAQTHYVGTQFSGNPPNSFTYGIRVVLDVQTPITDTGRITVLGEQYVRNVGGFWITIQSCTSTVLKVNYTFHGGDSNYTIDSTGPVDDSITASVANPFANDLTIIQGGIHFAVQMAMGSDAHFLGSLQAELSRLALSLSSGIFVATPSISEAWWRAEVVTRIGIIPMISLESVLLLYAAIAIFLLLGALYYKYTVRSPGKDQSTLLVVHDRLTKPSLLVLNELFHGNKYSERVGIDENGPKVLEIYGKTLLLDDRSARSSSKIGLEENEHWLLGERNTYGEDVSATSIEL